MNDKNIIEKTGRSLNQWFRHLESLGAGDLSHKSIADHLHEKDNVDYWRAQTITVEYERHIGRRIEGQTADGLFQLGIRRTLQLPPEELWILIMENLRLWSDDREIVDQSRFTTFVERSHFRMPWQLKAWDNHSVLQIRVMESPDPEKSVLAVHQEKLPDLQSRVELKEHWNAIFKEISQLTE